MSDDSSPVAGGAELPDRAGCVTGTSHPECADETALSEMLELGWVARWAAAGGRQRDYLERFVDAFLLESDAIKANLARWTTWETAATE